MYRESSSTMIDFPERDVLGVEAVRAGYLKVFLWRDSLGWGEHRVQNKRG